MDNISVCFDRGVPQISCTGCGSCSSVMGRSLCKVTDRGCCYYFPEFTLVDIQRMAVMENGLKALNIILSNPGTIIHNYSIHAKGAFDKEAYDQYIESGNLIDSGSIKDHTIFFKTCPFVIPGSGCKLSPRFRTLVCNLFICSEILEQPDLQETVKAYLDERSRYARWEYQENLNLQHILTENRLNLVSDFVACVKLLSELSLELYEFPVFEDMPYTPDLSA